MKKIYDTLNGKNIYLYTVRSGKIEADVIGYGAALNALRVNGTDIILGFKSVAEYEKSRSYAGATIGRVANRIAGGIFTLNGKKYILERNSGKNHLHGGVKGFDTKPFTVLTYSENRVVMQYESADGEENYPGNLRITVSYTVSDDGLEIEFTGLSDKDTLWCPTNHSYFNLDGENNGDCRDNLLQINADFITPTDAELIPTGEKRAVNGTPFDFSVLKAIGADFGNAELEATNGYDHNYILNGSHAARAEGKASGIKMDVFTDLPCLQFYSGGMLNGCEGKTRNYGNWAGFCLEPQFCPDSINISGFLKPILYKDSVKRYHIKFQF